jgi:hypothetical protein
MGTVVGYAEVASAVIVAFALAVGLEWVGLYGLTRLLSDRQNHAGSGAKGSALPEL